MSSAAHWFGRVEFWILNICFLQAGVVEITNIQSSKFKIQNSTHPNQYERSIFDQWSMLNLVLTVLKIEIQILNGLLFLGARKKVSKLSKTFLKKKMNLEKSDLPLSRLMVKPLTHLLKGITTRGCFYLVIKPLKWRTVFCPLCLIQVTIFFIINWPIQLKIEKNFKESEKKCAQKVKDHNSFEKECFLICYWRFQSDLKHWNN